MKTTNTFSLQFIIRTKKNNSREAIIYARINANKKRLEISLKKTIDPALWDNAAECVKGNKPEAKQLNKYVSDVRFKLMDCYHELQMQNKIITADAIKNLFLGETKIENTICGLMQYHNENMKTVLTHGTLKNYYTTEKYVKLFLEKRYKTSDIFLSELNYQFITEFEFFLRRTVPLDISNPLSNNGIMKHIERLRKTVTLAAKMEWIPKDPFTRYKLRFQKTEREFLNAEELSLIENVVLKKEKLERARDLFVFSCYTGLSYIDLINLKPSNVIIGIDGEYWIKTSRQKTDTPVNVPLLPPAFSLIEKYRNNQLVSNKGRLLPYLCNQKLNEYLKEIATLCDIKKYLNFHLARHTFSTTVTLANGVPLETVSKMLGHTKLSTTQIYVHVLEKKIGEDMKALKQKFAGIKSTKKDNAGNIAS